MGENEDEMVLLCYLTRGSSSSILTYNIIDFKAYLKHNST